MRVGQNARNRESASIRHRDGRQPCRAPSCSASAWACCS